MPWYRNFEKSTPLSTDKGIKARSKRGAFVENWWASRWIETLERLMNPGRLRRGKRYARKGQVLTVEETAGGVTAEVQGSRPRPYHVTIRLEPLSDEAWEAVLDALAEEAHFTADLLAGAMPPDIKQVFEAAGVSLFPDERGELHADCSCPDWAEICKHIAATHYILGERFDEDPFLLFRLRGRTREEMLEVLRARRGVDAAVEGGHQELEEPAPQESAPPLAASMASYWRAGDALDTFSARIEPPATPLPVLKRLGRPAFLDRDVAALFAPAYTAMSEAALAAAFQEIDFQDPEADKPHDDA